MVIDKSDSDLPVVVEQPLPIVTAEDAKKAMEAYQQLCAAILIPWEKRIVEKGVGKQESDYQRIRVRVRDPETGRDESVLKDFPRKSAWRKLAKFYNVSTEIVGKERVDREDGSWVWHYTVKAKAPNGQSQMGIGSCDSKEVQNERRREHDTESTAHTRSKNRAISDLIGFGQVSAEEVESTRKHVESEQVDHVREARRPTREPSRSTQLKLGRINANVIAYNLKAIGIYVENEDVSIVEEDDGFYVEPSKGLTDDDFKRINKTLGPMGAKWKADDQYWVFWKEADG